MIERVPTHIEGFDELIQGGLPQSATVLISGGPGTGKTIFCMEYIYQGTLLGEPGLYITIETNLKNVLWDMESFNWNIGKMQQKNLFKIYRIHITDIEDDKSVQEQIKEELETIAQIIDEKKIKRLAIDSISAFAFWLSSTARLRHLLFEFIDTLKNLNCTTLLISETKGNKMDFSTFGIEEFITDAVVKLYFNPPHRSIFIRKMRGTKHSQTLHPLQITYNGIKINPKDEIFWETIK